MFAHSLSTRLVSAAGFALTLGVMAAPALAEDEKMAFATHFMSSWDADSDGKVTLEEATIRRTDIFASFDADSDGFLTDPELALMEEMRSNQHENVEGKKQGHGMGQGGAGFQAEAEAGMHDRKAIDANSDGKIAKDEFVGMTQAWFARLDANSDGVIGTADF
jgi:hypothetical protein